MLLENKCYVQCEFSRTKLYFPALYTVVQQCSYDAVVYFIPDICVVISDSSVKKKLLKSVNINQRYRTNKSGLVYRIVSVRSTERDVHVA